MNNIEHTIDFIKNKFDSIECINNMLTKILIPIIHSSNLERIKTNENDSQDLIYDLRLESIIEQARRKSVELNKTNSIKFFYKNLIDLNEKYELFKQFHSDYDFNIIYYITNYFFYKNKQIENNKNNIINDTYNKDVINIYKEFNSYISFIDVYGSCNIYCNYISEFIDLYINENFIPSKSNNILKCMLPYLNESCNPKDIIIINKIIKDYETIESIIKKIKTLLNENNKVSFDYNIQKNKYENCELCNGKMNVKISTSELTCAECGNTVKLIGTVLEDNHFYGQEGGRYKHGSYNPMRHCKTWVDSIQAKGSKSIDPLIIQQIKDKISKNKIVNVKNISIDQYRKYLKDLKLTKYNNHITLIRKYISGISPPQLSHDEINRLYNYFDKSIKTYLEIKPPNKRNSMFYPFYIYKIIEIIIEEPSKKKELLNCIHLQEKTTLIDNDKYWKKICEKNNFCFIPTDKTRYQ